MSGRHTKKQYLEDGEATFNSIYCEYKCRSKRKGIEFSITREAFKLYTKSNCEYCNTPPYKTQKKRRCTPYTYNGLDRIDNSLGYVEGNVITCCEICNKAKRDLSLEEFIRWVQRLTYSSNWKKFLNQKS